jgi:cobalt/nickel transport system permease protein
MLYSQPAMHIPDGFLGLGVSITCWLISIFILSLALRSINRNFNERQVPLMGVMAAFIFAAQMINFPVAGGTSGHLLGGTLAAVLLGPWSAMLVMTAVLSVQALLFQDGGLLALGANILNMGLLAVIVSYGLYRLAAGRSRLIRQAATGVSAWLAVMTAALATSLQLWLSGTARLGLVLPAMLAVHALIGLGEAFITVTALAFIERTRPDLLPETSRSNGSRGWVLAGLGISLLVVILSPLASIAPDGLERVAHKLGFSASAQTPTFKLLPNYSLPFLGRTSLGTILAGVVGLLIVTGLVLLLAHSLRKKGG